MSNLHKISHQEAAGFLECSTDRVLELIRDGVIPAVQFGKSYVIPRQAFYEAVSQEAVRVATSRRCIVPASQSQARTVRT